MATRRGPDNTVRFSIAGTNDTIAWANVFWASLTVSGTPTQTDLDTWLTAAQAAYKTRFASRQQTSTLYAQAQALLFLPGNLALPSIVAMTGAGTATNTGTDPADLCSVLSWQTGVYWRGGKPRTYLPAGPTTDRSTKHTLNAGAITALLTAGGGYRTDVNALTAGAITGTQLGFVSFRSANADRVPPVFFTYTGIKVHPRLGSQRRRLGKWLP